MTVFLGQCIRIPRSYMTAVSGHLRSPEAWQKINSDAESAAMNYAVNQAKSKDQWAAILWPDGDISLYLKTGNNELTLVCFEGEK